MWDQLISIVETGNMEERRIGNIMKTAPLGNNEAKKILLSYLSSLSHFEGLFTGDDETKKHKGTRTLAQCSTSRKKSWGQLAPKFSFLVARMSILVAKN